MVAEVKLKRVRGAGGCSKEHEAWLGSATVCDQEQASHLGLIRSSLSTTVVSRAAQTRGFWGNLGFPGHKLLSG